MKVLKSRRQPDTSGDILSSIDSTRRDGVCHPSAAAAAQSVTTHSQVVTLLFSFYHLLMLMLLGWVQIRCKGNMVVWVQWCFPLQLKNTLVRFNRHAI